MHFCIMYVCVLCTFMRVLCMLHVLCMFAYIMHVCMYYVCLHVLCMFACIMYACVLCMFRLCKFVYYVCLCIIYICVLCMYVLCMYNVVLCVLTHYTICITLKSLKFPIFLVLPGIQLESTTQGLGVNTHFSIDMK